MKFIIAELLSLTTLALFSASAYVTIKVILWASPRAWDASVGMLQVFFVMIGG